MQQATIGQEIFAVNVGPLPGNTIAPPLKLGQEYEVVQTHICKCGQLHLDVGLKSKFNSITCYKCREELPGGDTVHWANSIRFTSDQGFPVSDSTTAR